LATLVVQPRVVAVALDVIVAVIDTVHVHGNDTVGVIGSVERSRSDHDLADDYDRVHEVAHVNR
jgi:hypothetical protein